MPIHQTLTDRDGNEYKVVKSWWLKAITSVAILNTVILMAIIAGLIDNVRRVEQTLSFSDRMTQRTHAIGDIVNGRTSANIWTFNQVCQIVKDKGQECMPNPQWYADPKLYPLIVNDEMGAGLFPPSTYK